jgi:hypothetical protein
MTKLYKIEHCNECPFFFRGNEYMFDSYEAHICLNPAMGDPDGYDVPITKEGQGEPFWIGDWDIPSWCKLEDIVS